MLPIIPFARNIAAGLAACFFLLCGGPLAAADLLNQPWKVEADKVSRSVSEQEIIAEGNVVLERTGTPGKPMTILADWIRYDTEAGIVQARGNVKLRSNTEKADAREATIFLSDQTAQFIDSKIHFIDTNITLESKEARRDGEMVYFFRDGVFTSCDYDEERSPAWSLALKEADIDVDGFIFMKHSVLRIKRLPVLYLPFMAYPGRMERQTGFLDPEISGSDRGGSGLITPFFWNLSPSSDITLYPGYYAKRGPIIGGEFRTMQDERSRFSVQGTFIDDRVQDDHDADDHLYIHKDDAVAGVDYQKNGYIPLGDYWYMPLGEDYQEDGYLRTRSNRYWVRSKADYDFGDNLKLLADIDFASDRDFLMEFDNGIIGSEDSHDAFLRDFDRGLQEASLPWRQSSLQLAKHWSRVFVGAETSYVDDLNPSTTPDTTVIHTLPRLLTIGSLGVPFTRLNLNWQGEYVNYWREEGVGMQRLDLHPRLTTPIPLGRWLEASITGGFRQTNYQVETYDEALYLASDDSHPSRRAWDGEARLSTTFQRDFGVKVGSLRWLNHTVKPHTSFSYIDPDNEELVVPDFDAKDTLRAASEVGYGLENHFLIGGVSGDDKEYSRYFGSFKIKHSYDYRKDVEPYGDLRFELDIFPLKELRLKYSTDVSVYGRGVVGYDLLTRYTNQRGDFLSVDYRYNQGSDTHEINGQGKVRLTETLSVAAEIKKSLALDNVVSQSLSVIYQPGCWGMQVELSESGDDRQLTVMFSLVALGQAFGFGYEDNLSADTSFTTSTGPLEHDNF